MSNGDTLTVFDANVCILGTESFGIGQKVSYQGRILYCAPPGAWIDYGPADPVPLLERNDTTGLPVADTTPGTRSSDATKS